MKKLLIFTLFILPALAFSQTINQKATDTKKNNEMLIGYCNRYGFSSINSNFDSAYQAEYRSYVPDATVISQLTGKLKGIKVTLVMATWCSDSKEWVPRFYKIMDMLDFDYHNLTLICVDRDKKAPGTSVDNLKIDRVPTFIFYKENNELGRIIEVPADLLEKDMLKIVSE
jgi:hypothetical protein